MLARRWRRVSFHDLNWQQQAWTSPLGKQLAMYQAVRLKRNGCDILNYSLDTAYSLDNLYVGQWIGYAYRVNEP